MALAILGAGIAAIGSYTGALAASYFGMSTIGIGWTLGSMLGGSLQKQPDQEGPRLSDLSVANTSYGAPIPRVFRMARVTVPVFWSTPKIEAKHTEDVESGGKGGQSQEVTTYTYSISFAVALNDGEIAGVGRIWANKKLIYDVRAANTGYTGALARSIRIYTGSETQGPDPFILAYQGGKAPAYLGTAYAVFEGFQLGEFGNQMPLIEAEVIQEGTWAPPAAEVLGAAFAVAVDPLTGNIWSVYQYSTWRRVQVRDALTQTLIRTIDVTTIYGQPSITYVPETRTFWIGSSTNGSAGDQVVIIGADSYQIVGAFSTYGSVFYNGPTVCYVPGGVTGVLPPPSVWCFNRSGVSLGRVTVQDAYTAAQLATFSTATDYTYFALHCGDDSPNLILRGASHLVSCGNGNWMDIWDVANYAKLATVSTSWGGTTIRHKLAWDKERDLVWWGESVHAGLYKVSLEDYSITLADASLTVRGLAYADGYLYIVDSGNVMTKRDPDTLAIVDTIGTFSQFGNNYAGNGIGFLEYERLVFAQGASTGDGDLLSIPVVDRITPGTVTLDEVVAALSADTVLEPSEYDVTDLAGVTVDGYVIARPMSRRAAIEELMGAYFFDAVESA